MTNLSRIHKDLRLRVSKRARRMALRLDPKERVVNLVVPQRANIDKAYDFARQHKEWISHQIANLPAPIQYEDGDFIPILGRKRLISIYYNRTLKRTDIILKHNEITVFTNKEDPSSRIERFLKDHAKKEIHALAHDKAEMIGKKIKSIHIRDTKSRWGSCSHDRRLSFSWRLIFAPMESFDYVIAHEIAHMRHMNHGPRFWALCEELCLDYEKGKGWMRQNSHELMRYG